MNRNGEDLIKTLCPILTAAEGWILGVGAKMFTIATGYCLRYNCERDLWGYLLGDFNNVKLTQQICYSKYTSILVK